MTRHFLIIILVTILSMESFAQITAETQAYRNDEYGDIQYRREGVMDGNLG